MKRILSILLTIVLMLSFMPHSSAEAKTKVKKYKNCTALNKDYKGGVAKSKSTKNKGGKTKYKPYVSKALYDANKKMDRDKDGIACER
ncbi:excalibur domain-containing protein [Niallia circulans]|uniref:Excalibur calcium-binding domain-containing protein n=2 Tax=Bacillaceae TaxID=186817 RepID=A0A0J1LH44_NIACI|nr:excalibur calcium-binding domain-containing protein [Niallia circulans]KLV28385.1 hypothetical protein ABW02_01165 [Niallia circulans]MCM2979883.1 excalibur calcium-binding domain-containing protein [Niallia circulans]MED3837250.1 excalibur calcium-binding domain-containing protein [Niallia circulans]MED4244320.1 excalibur calcium-binding domain-containing protein [Niallia circulans]MED4248946.1 excalibur calcium-binding domain-containing protein [Niallia circulans]